MHLVLAEASAPRAERAPETCDGSDRFHDYVLLEYEPVTSPVGRLRSLNVLVESFALAGLETEGVRVLEGVRDALGPFRTVWGIKWHHAERRLGWELYFYDFERAHADLSIDHLTEVLAPWVVIGGREPRPLPWHMFSVELGAEQLRREQPAALDIYVDMRSYKCSADGLRFENVYTFHHAKTEVDEVLHRLRTCLHLDPERDRLADWLPPHLFDCRKICVANKRAADALYFSRVRTSALQRFLGDHDWPAALRGYIDARADGFAHLLWDVGVDFQATEHGAAALKTGIYGSF